MPKKNRFLRKPKKRDIKRILVIYWGFYGDVLVTTPLLEALRRGYPCAYITYVLGRGADHAEHVSVLLKHNPHVDECLVSDTSILVKLLKRKPYDMVIDLCDLKASRLMYKISAAKTKIWGEWRNIPKHFFYNHLIGSRRGPVLKVLIRQKRICRITKFLSIARFLGINTQGLKFPKIYLLKNEKKSARKYLARFRKIAGPLIAMHPGGQNPFRLWKARNYSLLADELIEKLNARVIIFNTKAEEPLAKKIAKFAHHKVSRIFEKDLRKYVALLTACDLFISTDGGPLQMALAVGVPTLGIFHNRVSASYWYNYRKRQGLSTFITYRSLYMIEKKNKRGVDRRDEKEIRLVFRRAQKILKR